MAKNCPKIFDAAGNELKHGLCIHRTGLLIKQDPLVDVYDELELTKNLNIVKDSSGIIHAHTGISDLVWRYIAGQGYANMPLHEYLDKLLAGDKDGA